MTDVSTPDEKASWKDRWPLKRILRWTGTLFALSVFLRACSAMLGSGPELEVHLSPGNTITITNTGEKPVTVTGATVNDRQDCEVGKVTGVGQIEKIKATTLKVGEMDGWFSLCNVVRVEVKTNQGSETYTFDRK